MASEASGSERIVVSANEVLAASSASGPLWTRTSDDLNVNLVAFAPGEGVPAHVNGEVDVLIVVLTGEGEIRIDEVVRRMSAGQFCLIPKGAERAIRATTDRFAYVTCHRRRGGLMPA